MGVTVTLNWVTGPPKKPGRYWLRYALYCKQHQGGAPNALCECGETHDRVLVATKNALFNTALAHCRVPHPDGYGHDPADKEYS